MRRFIKLSELIDELQIELEIKGNMEIASIGTSSGNNGAYKFYDNNVDNRGSISVKVYRED